MRKIDDDLFELTLCLPSQTINWLYTLKNLSNYEIDDIINMSIYNLSITDIEDYSKDYIKIYKKKRKL